MISVKDILDIEMPKGVAVLAGQKGLSREVKNVSIMDSPEDFRFIKGGEVLMISETFTNNHLEDLGNIIETADKAGVVAMAIKSEKSITQNAMDASERLQMPLILIPHHYSFNDVIHHAFSKIINEKNLRLRFSENVHKCFTELALKEESTEKVLDALSKIIKRSVGFFDCRNFRLFANAPKSQFAQKLFEIDIDMDTCDIVKKKYDTYSIYNKELLYGLIIMGDEPSIDLRNQKMALEHAATVLALDSHKRLSDMRIEARLRDELVRDIIYNNITTQNEIENRANLYNWDFSNGAIVVMVDIDDFKRHYTSSIDKSLNLELEKEVELLFKYMAQKAYDNFEVVAYSRLNDAIIFIIADGKSKAQLYSKIEEVFGEIKSNIKENSKYTASIGVGQHKQNPMELYKSYDEAKKCILISTNVNKFDSMMFYDRLGIYKLLDLVLDSEEAIKLLDNYVYKIEKFDRSHNSKLLNTLIAICECSWNLKAVSKQIFVHYNTIKYRYSKICEILGTDFKSVDDRIKAEIAIKMYQMLKRG